MTEAHERAQRGERRKKHLSSGKFISQSKVLYTASFAYIQAAIQFNLTCHCVKNKVPPLILALPGHISYKNVLSSLVQEPKAQGLWL